MRRCKRFGRLQAIVLLLTLVIAFEAAPARAAEKMTDGEIAGAIETELIFDRAVPADRLRIVVEDGIVTLSGELHNLLAAQRAVRIAQTVRGVRAVIDQLEVTIPRARTDAAIRRDITMALLTDPATEAFEIDAKVDDGIVTLTGQVQSWQEQDLAARVAKGVRGVRGIDNKIDVKYQVKRQDNEMEPEVERALRWDVLVDHAMIDVKVKDGRVTLSGTVGSAAERKRAIVDAWVAGVRSVDAAELKVRRWARDPELRQDKYIVKSDEAVRRAVLDALLQSPRVSAFQVTPEVNAGVVTLRGVVQNLKARRTAEEIARNTVGVARVKNRIKVRPKQIADAEITRDVQAALARDPYVERFDITVSTVDGVVYMSGTVDSWFEKGQADDVAARVPGVHEVKNRLDVRSPAYPLAYDPWVDETRPYGYEWYQYEPTVVVRSDQKIRDAIAEQMRWSPYVDVDGLQIRVEDAVATLTGTVDSRMESEAAAQEAYEGGAVWVRNKLNIEAPEGAGAD